MLTPNCKHKSINTWSMELAYLVLAQYLWVSLTRKCLTLWGRHGRVNFMSNMCQLICHSHRYYRRTSNQGPLSTLFHWKKVDIATNLYGLLRLYDITFNKVTSLKILFTWKVRWDSDMQFIMRNGNEFAAYFVIMGESPWFMTMHVSISLKKIYLPTLLWDFNPFSEEILSIV